MKDATNAPRTAGRIGALALLVLAAVYGIAGATLPYSFSSDPLGPRVFPVILALLLAGLAVLYLRAPGPSEAFPRGALLMRTLGVPAIVLISVLLLEPAGFAVSTFVLTAGIGWIFGARPSIAILAGIVHAALWWGVFAYLLDVYLPAGQLFG